MKGNAHAQLVFFPLRLQRIVHKGGQARHVLKSKSGELNEPERRCSYPIYRCLLPVLFLPESVPGHQVLVLMTQRSIWLHRPVDDAVHLTSP